MGLGGLTSLASTAIQSVSLLGRELGLEIIDGFVGAGTGNVALHTE